MVLVVRRHVIEEDLFVLLSIPREMGSVVHFVERHLLQSSIVHFETNFILLIKLII